MKVTIEDAFHFAEKDGNTYIWISGSKRSGYYEIKEFEKLLQESQDENGMVEVHDSSFFEDEIMLKDFRTVKFDRSAYLKHKKVLKFQAEKQAFKEAVANCANFTALVPTNTDSTISIFYYTSPNVDEKYKRDDFIIKFDDENLDILTISLTPPGGIMRRGFTSISEHLFAQTDNRRNYTRYKSFDIMIEGFIKFYQSLIEECKEKQ